MTKNPSAIKLYRGVSIYRVSGSQNWQVRVWDRERKKYTVRSTHENSSIKARDVAMEYALSLLKAERQVDREYTFKHFAIKLLNKAKLQVQEGVRSDGYVKSIRWAIQNEDWGLVRKFGTKDVRKLRTIDFQEYINEVTRKRPDLTSSTKNTLMAAFRNVLKVAREEGVIDLIPQTPRARQKDNPRPFFRFYPLVEKDADILSKSSECCQANG